MLHYKNKKAYLIWSKAGNCTQKAWKEEQKKKFVQTELQQQFYILQTEHEQQQQQQEIKSSKQNTPNKMEFKNTVYDGKHKREHESCRRSTHARTCT